MKILNWLLGRPTSEDDRWFYPGDHVLWATGIEVECPSPHNRFSMRMGVPCKTCGACR